MDSTSQTDTGAALEEICDGQDNDSSGAPDDNFACQDGCTGFTYGGHAYMFCPVESDWTSARTTCIDHGMQLVRIDDAMETGFLVTTSQALMAVRRRWLERPGVRSATAIRMRAVLTPRPIPARDEMGRHDE